MKNFIILMGCIVFFFPLRINAAELMVVTEEWSPYNYVENNEVKGKSTEIVKAVLDYAKIKYSIHVYPWSRSYKLALEQPNVLIYTIIRIAPREKLFKWIKPLGNGGTTSLYRLKRNKNINPKAIEQAKRFQIIANENSMDHIWLKFNGFNKLLTPPKVENAIRMFFAERVDMIAFDDAVIHDEFQKYGFNSSDAFPVMPLFKTPPYMALSLTTSDEICKQIQDAYDALMKTNKIKLVN